VSSQGPGRDRQYSKTGGTYAHDMCPGHSKKKEKAGGDRVHDDAAGNVLRFLKVSAEGKERKETWGEGNQVGAKQTT